MPRQGPSGPLCSTRARPTTEVAAVRAALMTDSTHPLPPAHCMPRARSRWPPVATGAKRRTHSCSCRRCRSSPLMGSSTRSLEGRRFATNSRACRHISAAATTTCHKCSARYIEHAGATSRRRHSCTLRCKPGLKAAEAMGRESEAGRRQDLRCVSEGAGNAQTAQRWTIV